jgi:cytidylate kinase
MFIVAIDGPAGTGKGTITKIVAEKLGLVTIDTGATYRCITLAMIKQNVKLEEEEKIKEILEKSKIEFKNINGEQHTFLNDEDVSKEIRSNKVNSMVSQVSALKFVRYKMVDLQRKLAEGKDVIMEGRDIGTYVFPNADVKIYLDAQPEERARRRQKQNEEVGIQSTYEEVLAGIIARDENDKNKEMGALKVAEDAIVVDGTHGTIEENVQKVIEIINKKKFKNNETKSVGIDTSINQKKEKNNKTKSVGARRFVPKKNKTRKNNRKIKGNQKRTPIKNNTKRNRKKYTMGIIQNSI